MFQKGVSGNPGGRPKSMANALRAKYGEDGQKLVSVLEQYAFGKIKKCSHRDRLQAVEILLERGWGKSPQVVAGDPDNPVVQRIVFGGRYRPDEVTS